MADPELFLCLMFIDSEQLEQEKHEEEHEQNRTAGT